MLSLTDTAALVALLLFAYITTTGAVMLVSTLMELAS